MSDPDDKFETPGHKFRPATFTPPPLPGETTPPDAADSAEQAGPPEPPDSATPPPGDAPPPPPPPVVGFKDGVGRGVLFGFLGHFLQIILAPVTAGVAIFAIGISQLIYELPLYFYLKKNGQPLAAKGVMICMGITFLLNAACFGILMIALTNADFR